MITDYPEYLREEYLQVLKDVVQSGKSNDLQIKQTFSEKMSQYMNVQEKRSGNIVVECITNNSINDSLIIYSQ